jgi:hypothetical protein
MTAPNPRPRVVEAAFWSWLVAGVLLLACGFMSLSVNVERLRAAAAKPIPDEHAHRFVLYYHFAGDLWFALGLAVAYLAVRTRQGNRRFRRANMVLSLVAIVLLIVWEVYAGFLSPGLLATLVLMVAVVLMTRPAARDWFDAVQRPPGGGGD